VGERGIVHAYRPSYTRRDKGTGERVTKQTSGWAWRFAYHGKRYSGGGAYPTRVAAREAGETRRREVVAGQIQDPRRTTYETLETIILAEYSLKGQSTRARLGYSLRWLKTYFGDMLAQDMGRAAILGYAAARSAAGASAATIRLELAYLRRAFTLAHEQGRVLSVPRFPTIQTQPRKGFFLPEQLDAVLAALPAWWRPAFAVAALTGWRFKSEVLTRKWTDVDLVGGWLRLEPGESKTREGRQFPLIPSLRAIFEAQPRAPLCPWVFHRDGKPLRDYRNVWARACRVAGVEGRQPHDLRRTAIRNLERAGVPRSAGMALVGHRTERVYSLYAVPDETLLRWAGELLEKDRPENVVPIRRREQPA
jgi:integrase